MALTGCLAWAYEVTPKGVKRTKNVPMAESIAHLTGQKLNYVVTALLVVAVLFLAVDNLLEDSGQENAIQQVPSLTVGQPAENPVTAVNESERGILPNSVAVLPFDNLSPNPDDSYFAAGLHEEILSQLAKLRNLSVISRTSVLRYADSDLSIPEIARELNVGTVMEGSVRYANERVRITMQLIDAETDEHLWSETYDRQFDDIFAIESDIAMNLANALEAEFSLAEQEDLERAPTESPAAYALYLRAIASRGSGGATIEAVGYLDRAIELDPDFALAYGEKALRLTSRGRLDPLLEPETAQRASEAAARALALDPNNASAHAALAGLHAANGRWVEAEEAYDVAYRLNPNDTGILLSYGSFRRDAGQYDEATRLLQRAADLDPNASRSQLGIAYRYARDFDAAADAFLFNIDLNPADGNAHGQLAINEIARGNPDEGLRLLRLAEQLGWDGSGSPSPMRIAQLAYAYAQIDRPQDVERLSTALQQRANEISVGNAQWAMMHLALGDYDQAAERLEAVLDSPAGESGLGQITANQYSDSILEGPRFRNLRDRLFELR